MSRKRPVNATGWLFFSQKDVSVSLSGLFWLLFEQSFFANDSIGSSMKALSKKCEG